MPGFFSNLFDPPQRPSFFGRDLGAGTMNSPGDETITSMPTRRGFFQLDPDDVVFPSSSVGGMFGAPAPSLGLRILPISYGTQPQAPGLPRQDEPRSDDDGPLALNFFEKWVVTPAIRKNAMDALRGMTGGEFNDEDLNKIIDQVIDNIPAGDAMEFQSIKPSHGQITLTPSQYDIVSKQIELLSPKYRDKAKAALQRARESGRVTCPQCSP